MESFRKEDLGDRPDDWDGERGYKPIGSMRARHLYDSGREDARRGQRGRRRHFAKHELLSGNWLHIVDNELPLTLTKNASLWEKVQQQPIVKLCQNCSSFSLLSKLPTVDIQTLTVDVEKLRAAASSCDLCKLFLRCLIRHDIESETSLEIYRDCSVLELHKNSHPFLTILGDPAAIKPSAKTQIGLPLLPDSGSQGHFDIMRGWLHECDEKHEQYGCHSESKSVLPTRVLDVGEGTYSDTIYLYCSQKDEQSDYVALSHCWGKFSDEQRALFCTFKENLKDRIQGIETHKLPKTFRDAVRVTRELGQRYLWIDSLCIIQNDADDWRREANTMELVYSMACFTIAATSAENSTQGFLRPRRQREFVKIEKPPPPPPPIRVARSGRDHMRNFFEDLEFERRPRYKAYTTTGDGIWTELDGDRAPPEVEQFPLYICEHIDDFTQDVEKSVLNSRGWVFQERALSRRILHFSDVQTYWECGIGVHCETLSLMYNSESNILGDPQFPSSTEQRTDGQIIDFYTSLFKEYMQRDFTRPSDRAIAFASLGNRLAKALDTEVKYGIIERFLHRTLLWLRPEGTIWKRTSAGRGNSQEEVTPSWSWMCHEGNIEFMSIHYENIAWSEAVKFQNTNELKCILREFVDCRIVREGDEHILLDAEVGEEKSNEPKSDDQSVQEGDSVNQYERRSWLRFDVGASNIDNLKCAIMGPEFPYYGSEFGIDCYVLIVKASNDGDGLFNRVGVGSVDSRYISLTRPAIKASLI